LILGAFLGTGKLLHSLSGLSDFTCCAIVASTSRAIALSWTASALPK
jgi:hypothetical protein